MEKKEKQRESIERFKEHHDWTQYCSEARRRRVEKLKAEGCMNPWGVVASGSKPKYEKDYVFIFKEGNIKIPYHFANKLGIKSGDAFTMEMIDNKIIFYKQETRTI